MDTIEKELLERNSFRAIARVLNGIELHDTQCIDVMKMVYEKRCIVRYDTGTGKTLLAAAAMKLLWREDRSRRFLFFVKKDQLLQTPQKLADATGYSVISSCAEAEDVCEVFGSGEFLKYPVVMLTYACLSSDLVMKLLFQNKDKFCGVILDEAHTINNRGFAQCANVMCGMVSQFEYCWAMTATPILTDVMQFAKLSNVVDPKRYPNYGKLAKQMAYAVETDSLFFINRTASELGRNSKYNGKIIWVSAMPHQLEEVGGNQLMELCKGEGAVEQAKTLAQLIRELKEDGQRGLVYIKQHKVREWVLPFLEKEGIRYDCINGRVTTGRDAILESFNQGDLDTIITSVTTAIDADCDYVIFYEFTEEFKQMIGRADRGLQSKSVNIFYLLTKGSFEPLYFKEKIVDRSVEIKNVLGIDYKELEQVTGELAEEVQNIVKN